MRLIAIANISNNSNTIGFRILDIESAQIKNVPLGDIKCVLKSGNIQIENLEIKDDKVTGSNGSIERLPIIVNDQLVGKSPLIVLNQIGDIGYRVSDFKGTILNVRNTDIIKYANTNGISNGKVIDKKGKKFISSINGNYIITEIDQTIKEQYTGELDNDTKPLLPIITMIPSINYIYSPKHTVISYKNESAIVYKGVGCNWVADVTDYKKGLMYEHSGHTMVGCIVKELILGNEKHTAEIVRLLGTSEFRASIDNSIADRGKHGGKVDKETGLEISISKHIYNAVFVTKDIDNSDNHSSNTEITIIEKYAKYLKIMRPKIYIQYTLNTKGKVALARKCSKAGILYEIYNFSDGDRDKSTSNLEDIYYYHREYDNVIVNGTEMTIIGLDGAYRYAMELIHKTYNRSIVTSNKSLKASIFDPLHSEGINELGELKKLRRGGEVIEIPKNVKVIQDHSIWLTRENTNIIFGSNIEKCSNTCFKDDYSIHDYTGLNYIEIGSKTAGANIIDSLAHINHRFKNCVIHFTRDINVDEYIGITFKLHNVKDITSNNKNTIGDEFILDVVNKSLKNKLGRLLILKKPITIQIHKHKTNIGVRLTATRKYYEFIQNHSLLVSSWEDRLKKHASMEVQHKITSILNEIKEKLDFREKELTENKDKLYKQHSGKID